MTLSPAGVKVIAFADKVFGDPAKAKRWLECPDPLLSGKSAMQLLETDEGAVVVERMLCAIDEGMYT